MNKKQRIVFSETGVKNALKRRKKGGNFVIAKGKPVESALITKILSEKTETDFKIERNNKKHLNRNRFQKRKQKWNAYW